MRDLQLQRRAFEGMEIKGWDVGEWDRVPVTAGKGSIWSALRNWDEMLPLVEGWTIGIDANWKNSLLSTEDSMGGSSGDLFPKSSNNSSNKTLQVGQTRANSV